MSRMITERLEKVHKITNNNSKYIIKYFTTKYILHIYKKKKKSITHSCAIDFWQ